MRFQVLPLLLLVCGCASAPQWEEPTPSEPPFPLMRFFEGRTKGQGVLKVAFGSGQSIRVRSLGTIEPDGALLLVQDIEQQGKSPRRRHWRMRQVAPERFQGSLTDATGPVTGEVRGKRFQVAYPMKGGFQARQWLRLRPDGRTADNVLHVSKLGITVARLHETIRKVD